MTVTYEVTVIFYNGTGVEIPTREVGGYVWRDRGSKRRKAEEACEETSNQKKGRGEEKENQQENCEE